MVKNDTIPVLYSFRRCPYAMRARMAVLVSGSTCELREIVLRDKPAPFLEASPKGTVPVLVLPDGTVLEESLDIMHWALARDDPQNWLGYNDCFQTIISAIDGPFKHHLDRYKYATRYDPDARDFHRSEALRALQELEKRLQANSFLCGPKASMIDYAAFPFVRQFANTDRGWFDAQSLPALHKWLDGLINSEEFCGVMTKYKPWQPGEEGETFANVI